jgi:hypothetical protein
MDFMYTPSSNPEMDREVEFLTMDDNQDLLRATFDKREQEFYAGLDEEGEEDNGDDDLAREVKVELKEEEAGRSKP